MLYQPEPPPPPPPPPDEPPPLEPDELESLLEPELLPLEPGGVEAAATVSARLVLTKSTMRPGLRVPLPSPQDQTCSPSSVMASSSRPSNFLAQAFSTSSAT